MDNEERKKYKVIYGLVLTIFVVFFNFIWLNKAYPMAEGWSEIYSGLLDNGKIPYKDFYYYLPPLSLFVDYIIWKLSFGMVFIYRLWRLFERIFITISIYHVLVKKIKPLYSFIIVATASMAATSCCYDLIGDYNQTEVLLSLILGLTLLKYTEEIKSNNVSFKWQFLAGFIGGLMFLSKQPVVLANFIVYAIILIIFKLTGKEKNILKTFSAVIIGSLVPIAITSIILAYTGAFNDFINQVFIDISSKSTSLYYLLVSKLQLYLKSEHLFAVPFIITFMSLFITPEKFKNNKKALLIKYLLIIFSGILFLRKCRQFYFSNNGSYNLLFILLLLSALFLFFYTRKSKNEGLIFCIFSCLIIYPVYTNLDGLTNFIANNTKLNTFIEKFSSISFMLILSWFILHLAHNKKNIKPDLIILSGMGITSCWATLLSSGLTTIESRSAILSFPILAYLGYQEKIIKKSPTIINIIKHSLKMLFVLTLIVCISKKIICSYEWWGGKQPTLWKKTETSENKALKFFKLSKQEKIKYDEITKVIKSNSDEKSTIFSFPYGTPYNLLTSNFNIIGEAPIVFYDVCSDNYAEKTANTLKQNQPDIVIWIDIPDCLQTHEKVFRKNKQCGQRKIIEWFESVRDKDYELIGQASNVLAFKKKNNDISKGYTFIENKDLLKDITRVVINN